MDLNKESEPLNTKVFRAFWNFRHFHSIIHYYVDLSVFLVSVSDPLAKWWNVNRRKRPVSVYEIAVKYGKANAYEKFYNWYLKKVKLEKKTACGEYLGFKYFFVPIIEGENILGYLLAGAFSEGEITHNTVKRYWKKLTGLEASSNLPEFQDFVRVLLEMPVLEGPVLAAYQEALELFSKLLIGPEDVETIGQRLYQLLIEVFSKNFSHSYWLDWALGRLTNESAPAWNRKIEKWEWIRKEIGISRIPTTVLTVIPQRSKHQAADWTEDMIRVYRFQRRSFHFAQTLPQTVGGPIENYGAVFVTSVDPKKPKLMRQRQIEEIAASIHEFATKEWGGPVRIGVSQSVLPGESLKDAYHEALLALHLGLQSGDDISFYRPSFEKKTDGFLEVNRLMAEMFSCFRESSFSDLEALQDDFLGQVLLLSISSLDNTCLHLKYAILRLVEVVGKRTDLTEIDTNELYTTLSNPIGNAVTTQELVLAFKEALSRLKVFVERKKFFHLESSMEKIRFYVDDHFRESLPISKLAKIAGISISTFSRRFRKTSGMGLETYLQHRRLEEAKRLLKVSSLPVSQIALSCGFKNVSYFVDLFGRKTGRTPQKFRRKFQKF